jgi:hypothetical protein
MDDETLYELVQEAVAHALDAHLGASDIPLSRRMVGGAVIFEDDQHREVKRIPVETLFKKVTSVREKLRVLEQKLNNHKGLSAADRADMQVYITRCYGSLTTFNFLFAEDADRFRGTGS